MKIYKININVFAFLAMLLLACEHEVLDKTPLDRYSDEVLWSDINLADAYLLDTYHNLAMGFAPAMLMSVTDETRFEFTWGPENYVGGAISADNPRPWITGWATGEFPNWSANYGDIQKLNIFLANIDRVPEAYDGAERESALLAAERMKGEALFLRAYCYAQLALTYGGVPIINEPFEREDDYLSIQRSSFEETIDFISQDCDAASALLLTKEEMEMGKATKGAALALKSRVLLFAASDLTADGTAENQYVGYENPDRNALWTAARNAAKAVIDLGTYSLSDFGAPDKAAVAQNYYEFFRQKDLSNSEIIWGKMYLKANGIASQMNLWNGANGNNNWAGHNPTQNLVDAYQMEDGSGFFDHFKLENGYYMNVSEKYENENPYHDREPRFYGSILYDSAVWQPRFPNLANRDPLGIYDRRTRITIENGAVTSQIYGIDTRQGPIEAWNGSFTGYIMKKWLDHEITGKDENNDNVWIEFRYAEVLLNYAEALIELGETSEAATYINRIRNRVGMPDFIGDITAALRYERKIELAFEEIRWYDIRRWKVLEETLTDAMGIDITETNQEGTVTTDWKQIVAEERSVEKKMYWVPIPTDEMNKAPQLVQNPGY
ncbi:MAG: RagB/SusD family nutrient uptake outer membrane protein [Anditalea sp.]